MGIKPEKLREIGRVLPYNITNYSNEQMINLIEGGDWGYSFYHKKILPILNGEKLYVIFFEKPDTEKVLLIPGYKGSYQHQVETLFFDSFVMNLNNIRIIGFYTLSTNHFNKLFK